MKKVYLIVPLLLLAAFAFYYQGYRKEAIAAQEARDAQIVENKRKDDQEKADYQAKIAQEAREVALAKAREDAAKKAEIKKQEKEWDDLNDLSSKIDEQRDSAMAGTFELASMLNDEKGLLQRAKDRLVVVNAEKTFVESYIPKSKENRDRMIAFLTKVEDAKKQAEELARNTKKQ